MFIHFGPDTWTENRTDDELRSIDVLMKFWKHDDTIPQKIKHTHLWNEDDPGTSTGTTAIEVNDFSQKASFEKTFTWTVPENLRTTATYHHHQHPHDVENDQAYFALLDDWIDGIVADTKYEEAIQEAREELGAL